MLNAVLSNLKTRESQSIEGLKAFLRIPSVSTQPEHKGDCQACAQWLVDQLVPMGMKASVEQTKGHPIVLAKNDHNPGRPTVLVYGHYDVQPPEPLDQWITPPFDPTIRKTDAGTDAIYARGAVDDKGQVWCHVEAFRAWQANGGLPVNVTAIFEGEEEIGSDNLEHFLISRKADLKADIAVISDTGQFARGIPAITYGLRGLVYMEVIVTAAGFDLHSGMYGGAVPNPANILCEVLATLHDAKGRVNIPGFYDDVAPLKQAERDAWAKLALDDAKFAAELKMAGLQGEEGYTNLERRWARPTCDINGLTSGYQAVGAKTIIPANASAKVSMRLVPSQDPRKIQAAFEQAIRERLPKTVTVEFRQFGAAPAVVVPIEGKAMQLAARSVKDGFGKEPVLIREGGSIPVVGQIKSILGIDTLLIGFGLPDDRVHSPNEKFDLDALHNGTRTAASLYSELADL
jgi:acetylornithine deacetylase/succinyl-diaminopimelate desuccinylase-like protein